MKKILTVITLFLFVQNLFAQIDSPLFVDSLQLKWVDEKYKAMTLEEKVGQLFIVAAYSNKDAAHEAGIENLVKTEAIGGLIFMQDLAVKQGELTNRYNKVAKIPLLIGMDAEWGLSMRLKEVKRFPWAMTVGAVEDNQIVKEMGNAIGEQANTMGVHFNFAPVVDVNTNPKNPIIGNRSYGSDVQNVADKGINYMLGMKEKSVLASAKHFPGHGDTSTDSHYTTPVVEHDLARLKSIELAPFQKLIDAGVPAIMVAHLSVPALDDSGIPTTLSKKVVTDLLKNEMHFKGLIVTDALNMDGVAKKYPPGEVDLMAFEAGNDILLFSQDVKTAKQKIIEKINSGEITEERLAESVKKILMAKYFVGLNNSKPIDTKDLVQNLNKPNYQILTSKIYENAATLIKNEGEILPIQNLINIKIAYVPLEESDYGVFYQNLNFHVTTDLVKIKSAAEVSKLKDYDYVIIGLHKSNESPYKSYKISDNAKAIVKAASENRNVILALFGSPYGLMNLDLSSTKAAMVMYQNLDMTQNAAAEIIFGAIGAKGKLPVDVNSDWKFGKTLKTDAMQRLGFAIPEAVGMKAEVIQQIDELAQKAIDDGATPGLQIVAAKNGKVIYDKSFGYQTIERKKKVSSKDVYDVASVTKVTATLPLLMEDVSKGELNLDQNLASILPESGRTDKGTLKLREILAHQAGLPPWIGFYKESVNVQNARLYLDYYSRKQDEEHPIKVTDNIYIIGTIKDTIMTDILYAPLGSKKYQYSDLGYYLFQEYLEKKYKKPLDSLVHEKLYRPMQMSSTFYLPRNQLDLEQIIPTAKDKIYRNQLLHGFVQDEGAAMMGGVAGHAGLFSSAQDLAKLMQMYLNGGSYGGQTFFSPQTIAEFTKDQYSGNRRGAGFDKLSGSSNNGYGHYGYTGTMVWNDPDEQLVLVFLSNRVNPSVDNKKLANGKYRENVRQALYDAVVKFH
ncbi:glycoside hydrolase family 3 N-terminal domain-containing protein [Moheibacter lacus]|uniref:beta-N-acetylhexosaminidase n=1 Tax=Moheibacter lacus TaxID=2745851 RepID=A0A838ZUG3_9FLAO|nr:glycoside hydrolase family 3 N-terminal domain-containing protein [Moheibacter lacus]MBA5630634.1 serine hydrolase [Moheibacter lacus]